DCSDRYRMGRQVGGRLSSGPGGDRPVLDVLYITSSGGSFNGEKGEEGEEGDRDGRGGSRSGHHHPQVQGYTSGPEVGKAGLLWCVASGDRLGGNFGNHDL